VLHDLAEEVDDHGMDLLDSRRLVVGHLDEVVDQAAAALLLRRSAPP
jgi:hypothetical protein